MVEPLSRDIETASTATFEGFMRECENTLYGVNGSDSGVHDRDWGLTNHLVAGVSQVPFCIDTHGIPQTL